MTHSKSKIQNSKFSFPRYPRYQDSGVEWLGDVPEHWEVEKGLRYLYETEDRSLKGDEELLSVSHLTGVTPRSEKNITIPEYQLRVTNGLRRIMESAFMLLAAILVASCTGKPEKLSYKVISTRPHDPECYTQGLEFRGKNLIESSGGYGLSTIREVNAATGEVLRKRAMAKNVFVEGITLLNNEIWILTWKENTAYVFEPDTFKFLREHKLEGEGWGLTHDGKHLIASDGTSTLKFINPADFSVVRTVEVKRGNQPVLNLNELEMVNGQIFANIYLTDEIVRISPDTGAVTGSLDLSALRKQLPGPNRAEAMNGIALDPATGRLIVTGKLWPKMFEIEIGK